MCIAGYLDGDSDKIGYGGLVFRRWGGSVPLPPILTALVT
jgi:hypothetical protein